jgi:CheY-like chemotaxis protein
MPPVDGHDARRADLHQRRRILNNAAKYTVQSGLISLVAQRRGEQAVVRIRDNGPGIPASMLSEIFSAFRQVDSSLSRSHGGLGIGLWLARQIVELHGGTIVATSEGPGQGSEFVVALPALTAISVRSPDGQRDRVKPLAQPDYAVQHRILVVDDVHESAETLAMVLRSMGHDATALCDGETAIQWIIAHRPDAVFLDIAMPGLDGYEVARRLREHPELHEVVLVALTGYGQQEDRRRALDAGFNFHLTKPTAMTSLRELLSKLPAGRTTIEAAAH